MLGTLSSAIAGVNEVAARVRELMEEGEECAATGSRNMASCRSWHIPPCSCICILTSLKQMIDSAAVKTEMHVVFEGVHSGAIYDREILRMFSCGINNVHI